MKWLVLVLLICVSCQKEEVKSPSHANSQVNSVAEIGGDDFSDLKKKDDESCDTEEDLEKKLEKQIKESQEKKQAFKLQGSTDPGCEIE